MNKERRVSLIVNGQTWKDLKIFQIKNNLKSFNDLLVILSLKLLTGEVTISKLYNVKKELETYLGSQDRGD